MADRNRLLVERAVVEGGTGPHPPVASRRAPTQTSKAAGTRTGRAVTINLAESPLGWLRAHGHVDERQYEAGERLRGEWERAQLAPRVTMRWDEGPRDRGARGSPVGNDPTAAGIAAKARFDAAVAAVGPGLSDVLWRVVCAGEGMRDAETALGWPARAGKLVLGLALDRLADHYRIG